MNANRVFGLFVLIAGLALCGKGLGMLFSPRVYEAVVEIEVEPNVLLDDPSYPHYDPYLEREMKNASSDLVLSKVVLTLKLDEKWGKRDGSQFGIGETVELLRRRLDMDGDRETKIIQIRVLDKDPNEAAQIANAIADSYHSYRNDQHKQQMEAGIEKLEEAYQAEETNIFLMQRNVDQLSEKLDINDTPDEQELNETLIEGQANYIRLQNQFAEFQSIQATNPTALADILLTVNPDSVLPDLLTKLHENEQKLAAETNQISAGNPDEANTRTLIDGLKKQIDDRVAGIMIGYEPNVEAQKAAVDALSNQLVKTESNAQAKVAREQPYWAAKQHLQDARTLHQLLAAHIEMDKLDAIHPQQAFVTVVEPAVASKALAFPNRWLGGVWLLCGLVLVRLGFRMLRNDVKATRAGS